MKYLIGILTLIFLLVNNQFTNHKISEFISINKEIYCSTMCCPVGADDQDQNINKSCCADAICLASYSNASAINYSYFPELPSQNTSFIINTVNTYYKNQYSYNISFDFWNPPRV